MDGNNIDRPHISPKEAFEEELLFYADMCQKGHEIDPGRYRILKIFPTFRPLCEISNNVAILAFEGTPLYRAGIYDFMKGCFLIEEAIKKIIEVKNNPDVSQVIIWVTGTGCPVEDGVFDLAETIHRELAGKPCYALSSGPAVSGHYLIAAAAPSGFYVSGPFVRIGSVGVLWKHFPREDAQSVEFTIGEYKTDRNPGYQEHRACIIHQYFVDTITRYRNLQSEAIEEIRSGKSFYSREAIRLGLVNGFFDLGSWFYKKEFIPILPS